MTTVRDVDATEKSFTVTAGKYAGYSVEVSDRDVSHDIWYEERGVQVLRVHYRLYRIPRSRKFLIKHFASATAEDRSNAEAGLQRVPRFFEIHESLGRASKRRHADEGYYYWTFCAGTLLDDPAVQLELEMMIDGDETVSDMLIRLNALTGVAS